MLGFMMRRSLRRMLSFTALSVAIAAVATTTIALVLTARVRADNDRDARAFVEEQRIADHITALTYQQQLDAYRFLLSADSGSIRRFDAKGDVAEAEMRRYLFYTLSTSARLQIERMRELHQAFEVVAHRGFELVKQGDTASARLRLSQLDNDAAQLDDAVSSFLQIRLAQHDALEEKNRSIAQVVRTILILAGVALVFLAMGIARSVSRRVLLPLEHVIRTTEALKRGNADARVGPQEYDELKSVASAFNEMAEQMQLSRDQAEMQNEELRESLEQLHVTQDELVQRERLSAMGEMLAGLAHELNNPLGSVLGMAELLEVEVQSSPQPEIRHLESTVVLPLVREARRARDLVRNLLSFARKPVAALDHVSLADTITSSLSHCAAAFAQSQKNIRVSADAELFVRADGVKLEQVILNLATNALDAMKAGGGTLLSIRAGGDSKTVTVVVEDDGPGFADPHSAFTPFYTTKSSEHGTGLGLSLVQKFVSEFGGTVSATNRTPNGARVTITLTRAEAPVVIPAAEPVPEPSNEVAAAPRGRAPRVLIVDDEPALLEVQRRMLTMAGMTPILASSGAQAMEIIERDPPDLVISDLRMPGEIDGRALLGWLSVAYPPLAARALLVTGEIAHEMDNALPVPTERVIRKPFTLVEYRERVEAALRSDER